MTISLIGFCVQIDSTWQVVHPFIDKVMYFEFVSNSLQLWFNEVLCKVQKFDQLSFANLSLSQKLLICRDFS